MNINAVHQKLADDEVLRKADEFSQIVGRALFEYTCASESVEDCQTYLDEEGGREASALLRDVHSTAARALDRIDEANHQFSAAFRKLADWAQARPPRDTYRMAAIDALHSLGGRAPGSDILDKEKELLIAAGETPWLGTIGHAESVLIESGLVVVEPRSEWPAVWALSDAGKQLAEERARGA